MMLHFDHNDIVPISHLLYLFFDRDFVWYERIKNGFAKAKSWSKEDCRYADIKLNVVISDGNGQSMIAEVCNFFDMLLDFHLCVV